MTYEVLVERASGEKMVARLSFAHDAESIAAAVARARNLYADVVKTTYLARVGEPETTYLAGGRIYG